MAKCRYVTPKITKLRLADGAKKLLADLKARPERKATPAEIGYAEALISEAEADDLWIEVKHQLNAGEASEMRAGMLKTMIAGEKTELDAKEVGFATLDAYIVNWNLEDHEGGILPLSRDTIRGLDDDTCNQLRAVIQQHETAVEDSRKNARAGQNAPGLT